MRALDWLVSPKNLFLSLSLARSLAHSLTLTLMMELHLSRSFFSRSTSSASLIAGEGSRRRRSDNCAPPGSAPQGRNVQRTTWITRAELPLEVPPC